MTLVIQIEFFNAAYVSTQFDPDSLVVLFWGYALLRDEDGMPFEQDSLATYHYLPPQLQRGTAADTAQAVTASIEGTAKSAVIVNFLFNFLLSGSLNQLWGMINGLQVIVHFPLLGIKFPANALQVYMSMA